jgi:LacI family transcriptional regulator
VNPELVERVRAAAAKLGYRPNLTAASLRRADGRTGTIGLLVEDAGNPFSAAVHRAVEDYAAEQGVLVLAASVDEDPARERDLTRKLVDRRVDGLVVVPTAGDHRYVVTEQDVGTSFVFVDRPPTPLVGDAVVSDNRGGARTAVAHLLQTGRRRLAYLGDDLSIYTASERFRGFREAANAAGLGVQDGLERHGIRTAEQARKSAHELLTTSRPEAIFTSQNLVTLGVLEALHDLGLQHDVALVGFDDVPLAGLLRPAVTVMAQDPSALGRLAAERLFARMAGDESRPAIHTVPTRLVVRGSGEIPASSGA